LNRHRSWRLNPWLSKHLSRSVSKKVSKCPWIFLTCS